jgi:hypothetical protein
MSLGRCIIYQVLAPQSTTSSTNFQFCVFPFEPNTRHHIIIQSPTPSPVSLVHITLTHCVVPSLVGAFHITYEILFLSFPIGNPITCVHMAFNVQRCCHDCHKTRFGFPSSRFSSVNLLSYFFFFTKLP